jgi:aspartate/glutamate racemase
MPKRIVLIHAVRVAMEPCAQAFEVLWPDAERVNLLDDSLSVDRGKSAELTPAVADRIRRLGLYARDIGADGILYTCSAFGSAIEAVAQELSIPVLKPNEAMFEAALTEGKSLGMLATFSGSMAPMQQEFEDLAKGRARLRMICIPDAMRALQAGDAARHNALLAQAAPELAGCDAVMLAQFSTSVARDAVQACLKVPVLTSPGSAVMKLKRLLSA